jgi:hypothetical protein
MNNKLNDVMAATMVDLRSRMVPPANSEIEELYLLLGHAVVAEEVNQRLASRLLSEWVVAPAELKTDLRDKCMAAREHQLVLARETASAKLAAVTATEASMSQVVA